MWRTYAPHVECPELCAFVTAHFLFIVLGSSWLHEGKSGENTVLKESWTKRRTVVCPLNEVVTPKTQKKMAISDDTKKEIGSRAS